MLPDWRLSRKLLLITVDSLSAQVTPTAMSRNFFTQRLKIQ